MILTILLSSGNTGSSRFLDIDPNNIASVEVLKGLAATTLYGTLGKNGVILITTKAGACTVGTKKNEITVNHILLSERVRLVTGLSVLIR